MKKIFVITLFIGLTSCSQHVPVSNQNVIFALEQSHTLVKVGESVTFTARASGVSGRDEKIKWEAKGGDLESINNTERYARVEYTNPGTYAVLATLYYK